MTELVLNGQNLDALFHGHQIKFDRDDCKISICLQNMPLDDVRLILDRAIRDFADPE